MRLSFDWLRKRHKVGRPQSGELRWGESREERYQQTLREALQAFGVQQAATEATTEESRKPPVDESTIRKEDQVKGRKPLVSAQEQAGIPHEASTGAAQSAPNVPAVAKSQCAIGGSGSPESADFGVTPKQVASYRPTRPNDFLFFEIWLVVVGLAILAAICACYNALFVLVWYALLGMPRPFHSGVLPTRVRNRVEAYLHAKAEFEKSVKEAELERRRREEDYWRSLSGREFESEMGRLYRADGYSVEATPATGDEGADLLLRKDGELIVVQCKRQDKPVGPHIVRDLYGTTHHFHAGRAFLDATGGFTEAVRHYVRGKPIELHDLDYILSFQERLSRKPEQPE